MSKNPIVLGTLSFNPKMNKQDYDIVQLAQTLARLEFSTGDTKPNPHKAMRNFADKYGEQAIEELKRKQASGDQHETFRRAFRYASRSTRR